MYMNKYDFDLIFPYLKSYLSTTKYLFEREGHQEKIIIIIILYIIIIIINYKKETSHNFHEQNPHS